MIYSVLLKRRKDGIYYAITYKSRVRLHRLGRAKEHDRRVLDFKKNGKNKKIFALIIEAAANILGCDSITGIPSSNAGKGQITKLITGEVEDITLLAKTTREKKHARGWNPEEEKNRIKIIKTKEPGNAKILLVDDMTTTGETMRLYREIVKTEVETGVVMFSIASSEDNNEGAETIASITVIKEEPK